MGIHSSKTFDAGRQNRKIVGPEQDECFVCFMSHESICLEGLVIFVQLTLSIHKDRCLPKSIRDTSSPFNMIAGRVSIFLLLKHSWNVAIFFSMNKISTNRILYTVYRKQVSRTVFKWDTFCLALSKIALKDSVVLTWRLALVYSLKPLPWKGERASWMRQSKRE